MTTLWFFYDGQPRATKKGRHGDEGPITKVSVDSFWMEEHEMTYDEYILFQDETKEDARRNIA